MAHPSASAAVSCPTAARHSANRPRTGPSVVSSGRPASGAGQAAGSTSSAIPWPGLDAAGGRHTTAPRGASAASAGSASTTAAAAWRNRATLTSGVTAERQPSAAARGTGSASTTSSRWAPASRNALARASSTAPYSSSAAGPAGVRPSWAASCAGPHRAAASAVSSVVAASRRVASTAAATRGCPVTAAARSPAALAVAAAREHAARSSAAAVTITSVPNAPCWARSPLASLVGSVRNCPAGSASISAAWARTSGQTSAGVVPLTRSKVPCRASCRARLRALDAGTGSPTGSGAHQRLQRLGVGPASVPGQDLLRRLALKPLRLELRVRATARDPGLPLVSAALPGGGGVDPPALTVPHHLVHVRGGPLGDQALVDVVADRIRVALQRVAVAGPAGGERDRDDVVLHVGPGRPALELITPLAADAARAEHLGDVQVEGVTRLQPLHQVRVGHADARDGTGRVAAEQALRCLDLRVVRDGHHDHHRHVVRHPQLGGADPATVLAVAGGVLPVRGDRDEQRELVLDQFHVRGPARRTPREPERVHAVH